MCPFFAKFDHCRDLHKGLEAHSGPAGRTATEQEYQAVKKKCQETCPTGRRVTRHPSAKSRKGRAGARARARGKVARARARGGEEVAVLPLSEGVQLPLNNLDIVDVDRESRVREIIPVSQRLPPCRLPFDSSSNRNEEPVCSGSSQSVVLDSPGRSQSGAWPGRSHEGARACQSRKALREPGREGPSMGARARIEVASPGRSHTGAWPGRSR